MPTEAGTEGVALFKLKVYTCHAPQSPQLLRYVTDGEMRFLFENQELADTVSVLDGSKIRPLNNLALQYERPNRRNQCLYSKNQLDVCVSTRPWRVQARYIETIQKLLQELNEPYAQYLESYNDGDQDEAEHENDGTDSDDIDTDASSEQKNAYFCPEFECRQRKADATFKKYSRHYKTRKASAFFPPHSLSWHEV